MKLNRKDKNPQIRFYVRMDCNKFKGIETEKEIVIYSWDTNFLISLFELSWCPICSANKIP